MMGRLNIPEDQPIENGLLTRSLESAQQKIEGFHFDARKHTLEYDDVLNYQRKIVYERRRKILVGTLEDVESAFADTVAGNEEVQKIITQKEQEIGKIEFYSAIKRLLLQTIDMFWVEHLEIMEYTRGSVNLRAYGQRDPLVEYKREGLRLFKEMQEAINAQVASVLPNIYSNNALLEQEKALREVQANAKIVSGSGEQNSIPLVQAPKNNTGEKIGRNDLCHCGSGKKFKNCHGK